MKFLVPAFIVVEADRELEAGEIAGDFAIASNTAAYDAAVINSSRGTPRGDKEVRAPTVCYLDEELPTFKAAHGDEDENEHTLIDYIKVFIKKEKQR